MNSSRSQATASILSVVLSVLASSHHWLHMGILLLLGGSTNMMATMSGIIWIRRVMILLTTITIIFSVYRLFSHRCKNSSMIVMTIVSVLISAGFVLYTLLQFGW